MSLTRSPCSLYCCNLLVLAVALFYLNCLSLSAQAAEIGDVKNGKDEQLEERGRGKRFILQFRVPSPVGHFRINMMPPFISNMMSNIPKILRRGFLFGSNNDKDKPTGMKDSHSLMYY